MSTPKPSLPKRLVAELLGTFMLVFMGTFAITTGQSNLNIGLAFAVGAIGAIYAFGHISGAHLNPAITFALTLRRKFPWKEVVPYAAAQIAGSVVAALLNASIVGQTLSRTYYLGTTYPNVQALQNVGVAPAVAALITETVVTFILILTVLGATEQESPGGFAGLAIGLVLGLNVMLAADISGGSLNPARTLGPALAQVFIGISPITAFDYHWIYWVGPLAGSFIAALVHWGKS